MDNDKDIEIKRGEDLGLDEKIKAGAKAVGKKIGPWKRYRLWIWNWKNYRKSRRLRKDKDNW